MPAVPLPDPAPGPDGEQPPLPGGGGPGGKRPGGAVPPGARVDPVRCGPPAGDPAAPPDAADGGGDWDADAYLAWFLASLTDAAAADAVLAAAAPGLRYDSLARRAARLEIKLDPGSAKARRESARAGGRRIEARREVSGNMSFGGRELAVEEVLAARACNDADALGLRRAGLPGSLRELRVLAMLDRICGRDPFTRIPAPDPAPAPGPAPAPPPAPGRGSASGEPGDDDDADEDADGGRPAPGPAAGPVAPFPALVNLLIPAGTLLGWSTAPGEAGTWGLLDPADTRSVVHAASRHPRSRWCVTVTSPSGIAVAHGCARGPDPWTPPPPPPPPGPATRARDGTTTTPGPPGPDAAQQAQLAGLLRALNVTLSPIAAGTCDHRHREDRYTPSRKLGHLVRARTATCPAPGCAAQAAHGDLDHTHPYPDGPTDECNLSPPCRRHHRVKQAPG